METDRESKEGRCPMLGSEDKSASRMLFGGTGCIANNFSKFSPRNASEC